VTQPTVVYLVGLFAVWFAAKAFRGSAARTALLLAASWLFYASLDWRFLPLVVASSVFNHLFGRLLRAQPKVGWLWVGAAANVALLSVFKYLPGMRGLLPGSPFWDGVASLALPLGISFWTFQALSYLFDQYRGDGTKPTLLEYCLYMSFAPTVVSGPICRAEDLVPQFRGAFRGSWQTVWDGAQSAWVGVGMIALGRLLAAGVGGVGVDEAFAMRGPLSTADAWIMLAGYGFQIFFDFAGYSRLVIGVARAFGFALPENFDRPYLSVTPTEFWQRWHMSLSFWIRDYLFMPMAMARREVWWRTASLVFSMIIFGLWHKASWLFLLWGVYQGLLLACHRLWQQWRRDSTPVLPAAVAAGGSWLLTFAAINLSWTLFRADTLSRALALVRAALVPTPGLHVPAGFATLVLVVAAGYFLSQWAVLRRADPEAPGVLAWLPMPARYACYGVIFYLAVFRAAESQAFIYTQF
jgi:D-alanyl-lipoteichoic acid acyltransferase DltB (MBOAT superfamily)